MWALLSMTVPAIDHEEFIPTLDGFFLDKPDKLCGSSEIIADKVSTWMVDNATDEAIRKIRVLMDNPHLCKMNTYANIVLSTTDMLYLLRDVTVDVHLTAGNLVIPDLKVVSALFNTTEDNVACTIGLLDIKASVGIARDHLSYVSKMKVRPLTSEDRISR